MNSARRVLAIVHNPVFGGGMNTIARLAAPLRARGWETIAMVPDLPEAEATIARMQAYGLRPGKLELHRLRRTRDPRVHAELIRSFRREVRRLREVIRQERIDLVQAFGDTNPHLALAGHREGRAVVWTLYDTVTPAPVRHLTMPIVTRLADVILTTGRELARVYPGAESLGERCVAVFPAVDTKVFRPRPELRSAARARLGVPVDGRLIGTVGNRNPTKGHEHLARVAASLRAEGRDLWWRVLGAPSPAHAAYMAEVDEEIAALGLGERFAFVDPGQDVPQLLPAFDLFVLSSVPRSEGMPTVILEALSCGIPVIATDVGAVRECVEQGVTGFVVPPLDDLALAAAVGRLIDDDELRERLGAQARERVVERHGLDHCADVHVEAFELALAHRRGRGVTTRG